jgi:translocation and assembly module TamA
VSRSGQTGSLGIVAGTVGAAMLCLALSWTPSHAAGFLGLDFWKSDAADNGDIIDPVRYQPVLHLTSENRGLAKALAAASLLIAKKDTPPSGTVGLIQRARDDQANLVGKLYEESFFGGTVAISLDGRPLDSVSVTESLGRKDTKVAVTITIDTGAPFSFGKIRVSGVPGDQATAVLAEAGLVEGAPATSTIIHAAADSLVLDWQREGHPFARIAGQQVVADHATDTVDVTFEVRPGPYATIGSVTVTGTASLDAKFVEQQADVPVGAPYSPDIIERTRKNLTRIDALASAIVKTGDHVDAKGRVPLLIEVSERPLHTIGVGGYSSTTDGVGGEIFWLHRNLFGAGEKLRLDAELSRAITSGSFSDLHSYTGHVGFEFDKPGVFGPRIDWLLKGQALQEDVNPYYRRGVVFETGYAYRMTDEWSLMSTIAYDWSHIRDGFGTGDYSLLSTPLRATYDGRDNTLDATSGAYATLLGEPQYATNSGSLFFTGDAELRLYHALDDAGRIVLAARGRAGSIVGASLDQIPAHRRFYAGGGGSVRGYEYLDIGPNLAGYGPTGGLSRVEGSLEARVKLTDTIGVAAFTDAGYVATKSLFGGDQTFQVSAGLGLRYYTAVGPLRLDVAVPVNRRSGDPKFAVYFGIGQSF